MKQYILHILAAAAALLLASSCSKEFLPEPVVTQASDDAVSSDPVQAFAPVVNKEGCVPFADHAFKQAVLAKHDLDGDGDISAEEAAAVLELDIAGCGVKDLAGLDWFTNARKLDARDNDVEDAMLLARLPYLHSLNLKGNRHLKRFDVRGCSMYFNECDYEVTDDLEYYLYYRTMGVTVPDFADWNRKQAASGNTYDGKPHSRHSADPRVTSDWTREGEMLQVSAHDKGAGRLGIVLSGIGYIDKDIEDGTFDRIMDEAVQALKKKPGFRENWDYFDVYIMHHLAKTHSQWMRYEDSEDYITERRNLIKGIGEACGNDYCYCFLVDSHSNMAFEEFLLQQLPSISYRNGEYLPPMIQMSPVPNFDSEREVFYPFHPVSEIIGEHVTFDCIEAMGWSWKD